MALQRFGFSFPGSGQMMETVACYPNGRLAATAREAIFDAEEGLCINWSVRTLCVVCGLWYHGSGRHASGGFNAPC